MEKIYFKERISKYPNRKKLKIISKTDSEILAEVLPADEPKVEGTELSAKILNKWQEVISASEDNAMLAKNKVHIAEDNAKLAVKYAKDAVIKAEQAETVAEYVSKSVNNTFIPIKTSELFNDNQFVSAKEQEFSEEEKAQARANIGAGTSNFSGDYADLTNKPDIPDYNTLSTKEYVNEKLAELVNSAPETLDTLGELASALEENEDLTSALNDAVTNKVDKVEGKALSTNDYTDLEKAKLESVESGANKNVQADWLQTDTSADDFIKNKPTIPEVVLYSTTGNNTNGAMTQKAVTDELNNINSNLKATNSSVETLSTSLETTNSSVETLNSDVATINSKISTNETNIASNTGRIVANENAIVNLKNMLADTNATLYDTTGNNTNGAMTQKATTDAINAEATTRSETDQTLKTLVADETANRASADATLQTNMENEASARVSADATLQTNINNEVSARASADATLQNNIDNEASARKTADTTLQNNIDAEATSRADVDSALQATLDNKPGLIVTDESTGYIGEVFNDYTNNIATGEYSHAEGYNTQASGTYSHSEGLSTTASGDDSHAEGNYTFATGVKSHSEGMGTRAVGNCSHASGFYAIADQAYQTAIGTYNLTAHTGALFSVGNGSLSARSTAFEVFQDGHAELQGDLTANGLNINNLSFGLNQITTQTFTSTTTKTVTVSNVEYGDIIFLVGDENSGFDGTKTTRVWFLKSGDTSWNMSVNGSTSDKSHWLNYTMTYSSSAKQLTIACTGSSNMNSWQYSVFRIGKIS